MQLLKKVAEYVENMLRVIGITTIGLHLTEDLTVTSEQLLEVFRNFRNCMSSAPQLQEVSQQLGIFMPHAVHCISKAQPLPGILA